MSVYGLGKLVGNEKDSYISFLQGASADAGLGVSFDVASEDALELSQAPGLDGDGLDFSVISEPGDSDVIDAWNEAMDVGVRAYASAGCGKLVLDARSVLGNFILPDTVRWELSNTRLGRFASKIVSYPGVSSAGLAFFDGSIRQIVVQQPEECLRRILAGFLLPWDAGPDALYVWQPCGHPMSRPQ